MTLPLARLRHLTERPEDATPEEIHSMAAAAIWALPATQSCPACGLAPVEGHDDRAVQVACACGWTP